VNASRPLTPEDWRRINDLFHRALEQPPDRRAAFLDESCGGDEALRDEVASLLASHERAADFIEAPAQTMMDPAAPEVQAETLVGRQVGQYRIEHVLGAGGMGVVYLAEDVRLGRTVALKALAPEYVSDPARRERLRREARAAASLTHPGIATVYALEEFDGQIFIAGEYVPGETLREELARGPLSALRTIETALGVARALAAAHDRGIVHRDLKPENIVRTGSGEVKILDFGLARFRDSPAAPAHLTDAGMILGTPAYMSPEQIRGTTVDGRSDLFSLGIVLYELVSGVHPFAGSDPASTIARILEAEPARLGDLPPATRWNQTVLGELEDAVTTSLRKVPEQRYRSAHDLIEVLERARAAMAGTVSGARVPPKPATTTAHDARWWWQFHQAAAASAYIALLIPLWLARVALGGRAGLALFVVGLAAAIVAAVLRLHLWFLVRLDAAEWRRSPSRRLIRSGDAIFVAVLMIGGIAIPALTTSNALGLVLIASGVAVFLAFAIIEPATARAAFGEDSSS
jgi:eukaryotic-like serine/threonine-protein kinase